MPRKILQDAIPIANPYGEVITRNNQEAPPAVIDQQVTMSPIIPKKKQEKKSFTIYADVALMSRVGKVASANKVSTSEMISLILESYLNATK